MSNSTPYAPEAGSLAWRICNWFAASRNRGEERTAAELCTQFECKRAELTKATAPCVEAGLLLNELGTAAYVYKAGPSLPSWYQGVAVEVAPAKKKRGGGPRPRLPALDLTQIQVRDGVPLPPSPIEKGTTRWRPLLEKLDAVGKSATLPTAYKGSLSKAASDWAKANRMKFVFRTVSPDEVGIWRTA